MQPYSIEAVSPRPSNAVRSHEHPMLESGNLSFPSGRYILDFQPGEDRSSYTITHRIQGAALLSRVLDAGRARFVCIVSSPISSYRRTHVSETPQHLVRWNAHDLGEPPMFTPMVVCSEAQEITLSSNRDGVHAIWDNQRVTLAKGSRLAMGSVIRLESSILHLLSLHEDRQLKDGQFAVEIETEPFRFRVNLSTNLHGFLRYSRDCNRTNIMTHIVTACLARLQHEHAIDDGDSGWQSHRNLRALADYLAQKGLDHWADEDFRPEKVATALYQHVLPKGASTDFEAGQAQ